MVTMMASSTEIYEPYDINTFSCKMDIDKKVLTLKVLITTIVALEHF